MTLETERKIWIVTLIIIIVLVLLGLSAPKPTPLYHLMPDAKDYYLKEYRVAYYPQPHNETIVFNLNEGVMIIVFSNLNQSNRYEIGEIKFTCVGPTFDRLLDETMTNTTSYTFEWEPHGDVNHQYGIGLREWCCVIGWIFPIYEKVMP